MTIWTRNVLAAGVLALAASTGAMAAPTQGTLGATSTGSISITASVPGRVRISGLSDVVLTNSNPLVTASQAQDVCVWSNTAGRKYQVTASGSGAAGAFTLSDGTTTYPYAVAWNAAAGQSSGTALAANTALTSLASAATNSDCSAGVSKSATLFVSLTPATLQTMTAGLDATGTLTLVVAPE